MPYADPKSEAAKASARRRQRRYQQTAAAKQNRKNRRDSENARNRLAKRRRSGVLNATAEVRSGVCPVCLKDGPLVLDHDHATGAVRGWLCDPCNRSLGMLGDTLAAAHRLVVYLATPI